MECVTKLRIIKDFGKTKDDRDKYIPGLYDYVVIDAESRFYNCFELN